MVLQFDPREVHVSGFPRARSYIDIFVPSIAFTALEFHIESRGGRIYVRQVSTPLNDETRSPRFVICS